MSIARLAGQFRLTVWRADGSRRLVTPWLPNMVTDTGLNRLGTGAFLTHAYVGTGSVPPPAANDSALVGQVAVTSQILSQSAGASASAPYFGYRDLDFKFAVGTATGNLSEVGVGWDAGLFSRALIVDQNGDPSTITVLASESLGLSYRLKNWAPTADLAFTATVAGQVRNCMARAALANSGSITAGWGISGTAAAASTLTAYNGALAGVTGVPSGTNAGVTGTTGGYVSNNYEIGLSGLWEPSVGNLSGGISSFLVATSGIGCYQIAVDPPIAKTSQNSLLAQFKVVWGVGA